MKQYSFLDNENYHLEDDNNHISNPVIRKSRKRLHVPERRENARSDTLGSFASITSKYNNIYFK